MLKKNENLLLGCATQKYINDKKCFNPHAPDRSTPLRARCAEKCGLELTHR